MMPVSKISAIVAPARSNGGGGAVDRPALARASTGPALVERLAEQVEDAARACFSPTGTVIGAPVSSTARAAHAGRRSVHGDAAHEVVAQVLLHLGHQRGCRRSPGRSSMRVVDRGQRAARELDVDDGAEDLRRLRCDRVPSVLLGVPSAMSLRRLLGVTVVPTSRASAPPTISRSSLVIAAWRARLYRERQVRRSSRRRVGRVASSPITARRLLGGQRTRAAR